VDQPESTGDGRTPAPQSFDFERPSSEAPARPEWTPTAPSDAMREGPRSEP
jgi:hypothetical protein